jgi:hypothetical protein
VADRILLDEGLKGVDIGSGNLFGAAGGGNADSAPNTLAARSSNWFFQSLIWFGCTSCNLANSANVFSPRMASKATLALKIDE